MPPKKPRRVLVVEIDVTCLTRAQVDAILTCALRSKHDVSFKIETKS